MINFDSQVITYPCGRMCFFSRYCQLQIKMQIFRYFISLLHITFKCSPFCVSEKPINRFRNSGQDNGIQFNIEFHLRQRLFCYESNTFAASKSIDAMQHGLAIYKKMRNCRKYSYILLHILFINDAVELIDGQIRSTKCNSLWIQK